MADNFGVYNISGEVERVVSSSVPGTQEPRTDKNAAFAHPIGVTSFGAGVFDFDDSFGTGVHTVIHVDNDDHDLKMVRVGDIAVFRSAFDIGPDSGVFTVNPGQNIERTIVEVGTGDTSADFYIRIAGLSPSFTFSSEQFQVVRLSRQEPKVTSLNGRRLRQRDVYNRLTQGRAYRYEIGQSALSGFSPAPANARPFGEQQATAPSWTQILIGKHHEFVINEISSSNHVQQSLNTYVSGNAPLEQTAVPASATLHYEKSQRFVRSTYKLSASANLPLRNDNNSMASSSGWFGINQVFNAEFTNPRAGVVETIDPLLGYSYFHPVSGSYRPSTPYNPAIFEIDVPEYGRIRDIKVWVEFIYNHRGTGTTMGVTPQTNDGTGITSATQTSNELGLGSMVVALKSPNVPFDFGHPLWNDKATNGFEFRPNREDLPAALETLFDTHYPDRVIPNIYKNSYLLWDGPKATQTLSYGPTDDNGLPIVQTSSLPDYGWSFENIGNDGTNLLGVDPQVFIDPVNDSLSVLAMSTTFGIFGAHTSVLYVMHSGSKPDSTTLGWRRQRVVPAGNIEGFVGHFDRVNRKLHAAVQGEGGSVVHLTSGTAGWASNVLDPVMVTTSTIWNERPVMALTTEPSGKVHLIVYSAGDSSNPTAGFWHYSSGSGVGISMDIIPINGYPSKNCFCNAVGNDGVLHFMFSDTTFQSGVASIYHCTSGSSGWTQQLVFQGVNSTTNPLQNMHASRLVVGDDGTLYCLFTRLGSGPTSKGTIIARRPGAGAPVYGVPVNDTTVSTVGTVNYVAGGWELFGDEDEFGGGLTVKTARGLFSPMYSEGAASYAIAAPSGSGRRELTTVVTMLENSSVNTAVFSGHTSGLTGSRADYYSSYVVDYDRDYSDSRYGTPGIGTWVDVDSFGNPVIIVTRATGSTSGNPVINDMTVIRRKRDVFGGEYLRGSAYHTFDNDKDMRTIFSDSSVVRNPRSNLGLYHNMRADRLGDSAPVTELVKANRYPSPTSASVQFALGVKEGYGGFVQERDNFMTGSNFMWMLDARVTPGIYTTPGSPVFVPDSGEGSPPPGWLSGPGGTAALNEFPTSGSNVGPADIKPVYPLLDDVYVEKVLDAEGNEPIATQGKRLVGFRPGLRGTEVHGKWKLMIGSMFRDSTNTGGAPATHGGALQIGDIWFRQFRLEFVLDKNREPTMPYASKSKRFTKFQPDPKKRIIDVISGSFNWDVGVNIVFTETPDSYGRSLGITDSSETTNFAVFSHLTGTFVVALSASGKLEGVESSFLSNEFGTPYIPVTSGSGEVPTIDSFTAQDSADSRRIFQEVLTPTTLVPRDNTLRAFLARSQTIISTPDAVLLKLNKLNEPDE